MTNRSYLGTNTRPYAYCFHKHSNNTVQFTSDKKEHQNWKLFYNFVQTYFVCTSKHCLHCSTSRRSLRRRLCQGLPGPLETLCVILCFVCHFTVSHTPVKAPPNRIVIYTPRMGGREGEERGCSSRKWCSLNSLTLNKSISNLSDIQVLKTILTVYFLRN